MIMQKGTLWPIKNGPFRIQLILVTWTEKISNVYFCILWNKFLFLRFLTSNKTTETSNYQMLVFKKRPPGRYKKRENDKIQGFFFLNFFIERFQAGDTVWDKHLTFSYKCHMDTQRDAQHKNRLTSELMNEPTQFKPTQNYIFGQFFV